MYNNHYYELMLTIFTEETYKKNIESRTKINTENNGKKHIACLYSTSYPISKSIPETTRLFILEANNTNNRIEGIGFIQHPVPRFKDIYNDDELQKHNGFVYYGRMHISRYNITDKNEIEVFKLLDKLCFYDKTHVKRYRGIQRFPLKWLMNLKSANYDLIEKIIQMFKKQQQHRKI